MVMGQDGMEDMGMAVPSNSLPMVGGPGQHDYITMGGMFTILKVREQLPSDGSDPGWYQSPPDTLAKIAPEEDLKRDGIELPKELTKTPSVLLDDKLCGVEPQPIIITKKNRPNIRIKTY